MQGEQTSYAYEGYEIVKRPYNGTFEKHESLGFTIDHSFVVVDDFGDHTLPLLQQNFWSPIDAKMAIDAANHLLSKTPNKRWEPSTKAHEFNIMLCYRRNFWHVYDALQKIKKECEESIDFDENPREAVLRILSNLRAAVLEVSR